MNRSLHKKLNQTGQVLQRLGNFKALMDCMIVQNLVSVTHSELMLYLNTFLKVKLCSAHKCYTHTLHISWKYMTVMSYALVNDNGIQERQWNRSHVTQDYFLYVLFLICLFCSKPKSCSPVSFYTVHC